MRSEVHALICALKPHRYRLEKRTWCYFFWSPHHMHSRTHTMICFYEYERIDNLYKCCSHWESSKCSYILCQWNLNISLASQNTQNLTKISWIILYKQAGQATSRLVRRHQVSRFMFVNDTYLSKSDLGHDSITGCVLSLKTLEKPGKPKCLFPGLEKHGKWSEDPGKALKIKVLKNCE